MIEIFVVVMLAKSIGKTAREKGRSAGGYRAMLVLLWLAGEFGAGLAGVLLGIDGAPLYAMALVGAIAGGAISFIIVKSLTSLTPVTQTHGFPVIQSSPPRY